MSKLVAVTTARHQPNNDGAFRHGVNETYTRALVASGVIPLLIPSGISQEMLREIYERVDGILLTGGGDIDPQVYGADDACELDSVDPVRDQTEFPLVQWAYADDKPLFGICRGVQVINVALGGTLITDIPTTVGTVVAHRILGVPDRRTRLLHTVDIEPGSVLSSIMQPNTGVNSIHHQALDRVADVLKATAYAPDGVVEAVELEGAHFFVGVQWHPEELFPTSEETQVLFRRFTEALR